MQASSVSHSSLDGSWTARLWQRFRIKFDFDSDLDLGSNEVLFLPAVSKVGPSLSLPTPHFPLRSYPVNLSSIFARSLAAISSHLDKYNGQSWDAKMVKCIISIWSQSGVHICRFKMTNSVISKTVCVILTGFPHTIHLFQFQDQQLYTSQDLAMHLSV